MNDACCCWGGKRRRRQEAKTSRDLTRAYWEAFSCCCCWRLEVDGEGYLFIGNKHKNEMWKCDGKD
jgi:hypothetical protein